MLEKFAAVAALMAVASPIPAAAQELVIPADSPGLLCSLGQAIECGPDDPCVNGSPQSIGLPRFVELDLVAGTIGSPSPDFAGIISSIEVDRSQAGTLVLRSVGVNGRMWSAAVDLVSGNLTASITEPGLVFVLFGACLPHAIAEE